MAEVEWLPVVGWEGRYDVSSDGQIRNAKTLHILVPGHNPKGYCTVKSCRRHALGMGLKPVMNGVSVKHFIYAEPKDSDTQTDYTR